MSWGTKIADYRGAFSTSKGNLQGNLWRFLKVLFKQMRIKSRRRHRMDQFSGRKIGGWTCAVNWTNYRSSSPSKCLEPLDF